MKLTSGLLFAVISVFLLVQEVSAEGYPRIGIVYNENEASSLEYNCEQINSLEITCKFNQMLVTKPTKDEAYNDFADNLNRCEKEFSYDDALKKFNENFCDDMFMLLGIYNGSVSEKNAHFNGINGKKLTDKHIDRFKEQSPEIIAMEVAELKASSKICNSEDVKTACEDMLEAKNELELRTCKLSSNQFEQTFSRLISNNSVWTVKDKPKGSCGIINVSRFEKDSDYLWRYISQKVITNPNGTAFGTMKCSDLDQGIYTFSWHETGYGKNCEYIKFAP